ncbi:hypothetical protein ACFYU8_18115 [Brevibacillus sp. NPDC003359]|uniref:hypothetical protein n=1 Tax=unclassified Brevibacillus TaxID=2684853 RepID=UPI003690E47F
MEIIKIAQSAAAVLLIIIGCFGLVMAKMKKDQNNHQKANQFIIASVVPVVGGIVWALGASYL